MELEESKANCFIDDMIAVLQDGKVLLHRQDAQQAVRKLQDLKKKDFIITTEDFEDILRQIKDEMAKVLKSTENAATKSEEEYEDLKNKLTELKAQMSEAEKKHLELKNKFTVLETEQKEVECVSIVCCQLIYRLPYMLIQLYMHNCLFMVNIPFHVQYR
ncbi:kinesin-like protein KIF20B isoform X1 [Ruditapes philippinarum]|uniref:kinesin-like protein KIF20B isoform X1 n=1 Tax=Ruditapes philippinarum TaxID=129788 RepID=UPI00295BC356|nr:kinesin-like protein KIF20B isoform X1 [Ruditapes philippinarum]